MYIYAKDINRKCPRTNFKISKLARCEVPAKSHHRDPASAVSSKETIGAAVRKRVLNPDNFDQRTALLTQEQVRSAVSLQVRLVTSDKAHKVRDISLRVIDIISIRIPHEESSSRSFLL